MAKLTAEQQLQRAHVTLMRSKQFCVLSSIVMCGKSSIVEDVPTACTDGWNTMYGRKFFSSLDDKGRAAVVAHENFHKMLQQLTVWKKLFKENPRRANCAADHVINLMIRDLDPRGDVAVLPECALLNNKFAGLNTKQVYDMLDEDGDDGSGGNSRGNGKPMDEHDIGGSGESEVSEAEQQAREKMLDAAIRQGKILAGKMGSGGHRAIDELTEPKINWREQLREFVQSTCAGRDTSTWRRPNRRYLAMDVYMPSMQAETMGPLVIGIDTSGSIGQAEINVFASELAAICTVVQPESVTLLWWDTAVCSAQTFEREQYENIASLLKPAGGGGTDPSCVFRYVESKSLKPQACVMLTDGCIGSHWGDQPDYPVLWAITMHYKAPWGVSIRIED